MQCQAGPERPGSGCTRAARPAPVPLCQPVRHILALLWSMGPQALDCAHQHPPSVFFALAVPLVMQKLKYVSALPNTASSKVWQAYTGPTPACCWQTTHAGRPIPLGSCSPLRRCNFENCCARAGGPRRPCGAARCCAARWPHCWPAPAAPGWRRPARPPGATRTTWGRAPGAAPAPAAAAASSRQWTCRRTRRQVQLQRVDSIEGFACAVLLEVAARLCAASRHMHAWLRHCSLLTAVSTDEPRCCCCSAEGCAGTCRQHPLYDSHACRGS